MHFIPNHARCVLLVASIPYASSAVIPVASHRLAPTATTITSDTVVSAAPLRQSPSIPSHDAPCLEAEFAPPPPPAWGAGNGTAIISNTTSTVATPEEAFVPVANRTREPIPASALASASACAAAAHSSATPEPALPQKRKWPNGQNSPPHNVWQPGHGIQPTGIPEPYNDVVTRSRELPPQLDRRLEPIRDASGNELQDVKTAMERVRSELDAPVGGISERIATLIASRKKWDDAAARVVDKGMYDEGGMEEMAEAGRAVHQASEQLRQAVVVYGDLLGKLQGQMEENRKDMDETTEYLRKMKDMFEDARDRIGKPSGGGG